MIRSRTELDNAMDAVYCAMETGNPSRAYEALVEYSHLTDYEIGQIKESVEIDYGVKL